MPEHFTLQEVASGVHAAIVDISGAAVGNAAIIDTGDRTVVVDTFMTIVAAKELRATATELTGRDTFLTVNSHWHGDHTGGNAVFDDGEIVATARTVELVASEYPADLNAYEQEIDGYISTFEAKLQSDDEDERRTAQRRLATFAHMRDSIPHMRLALPNVIVDGEMILDDQRRVEIRSLGKGHTDSDIFVLLPEEGIVVAADLSWVGIHPKMDDGYPTEWANTVEAIVALGPQTVVPGHGTAAPVAELAAMAPYMRYVASVISDGTDPADVTVPPGSEEWAGSERFYNGLASLSSR